MDLLYGTSTWNSSSSKFSSILGTVVDDVITLVAGTGIHLLFFAAISY
jgi:hypothetical protein